MNTSVAQFEDHIKTNFFNESSPMYDHDTDNRTCHDTNNRFCHETSYETNHIDNYLDKYDSSLQTVGFSKKRRRVTHSHDDDLNDDALSDNTSSNTRSNTTESNKKYPSKILAYHYPRPYDEAIFIAGDREVHFNAHVDGVTITRIKKLISTIINDNKEALVKFDENHKVPAGREKDPPVTITYIVNSPGGSVHDVLDFVDYINTLRCTFANIKFVSIITGMVASAGTVMCIIADKRSMTRFAFAMIHELSTGVSYTNYTRIITHAEFIKDLHDALVTIYQECRGIDPTDLDKKKELEILLKDQVWMSPTKYKSLGFVDEIIANTQIIPQYLRLNQK